MALFSAKYFFVILFLLQTCLWWVVKNDPFFGDSIASTSKAALAIYESNFQTLFYPLDVDPGHPMLYPILMAASWKIFGFSLLVSHAVGCVMGLFIIFSFRKIGSLYLTNAALNMASLMSVCFATFLSLSAMMLNTALLVSFYLLAVHALLANKKFNFIVFASLMMLTHLQSSFFLLALAISHFTIDVFLHKQQIAIWVRKYFLMYGIPFLFFTAWLVTHYFHTGWLFHSPNYADADDLNGIAVFLKSVAIIGWRLVDYGMLPIHLITAIAIWKNKTDKNLATLLVISVSITALLFAIFLENTIGHRYFLAFQLLSVITAVQYVSSLPLIKGNLLYVALLASLVLGNFLVYPGKNLGDATLAYRQYFAIENRLEFALKGSELYSYAPIANAPIAKYLHNDHICIERMLDDSFSKYPVVLQSNVNAEFTLKQKFFLRENWVGKSYENGPVYVNVFYNPAFYPNIKHSEIRQPTGIEKWMEQLKAKLQ